MVINRNFFIRVSVIIAFLFILVEKNAFSEERREQIQLLYPGFYYAGTLPNQTGEKWFGLYSTDTGFELIESAIIVEPTRDLCSEDKENEKTGRYVTTGDNQEPIIFIRGCSSLMDGPVKTCFYGNFVLEPTNGIVIKMNNNLSYDVYATGEQYHRGSIPSVCYKNYFLKLFCMSSYPNLSRKEQIFSGPMERCDEGLQKLIWAGDLDRDGKLDMIIDMPFDYGQRHYTLFLSSLAKEPNMIEKAAEYATGSC